MKKLYFWGGGNEAEKLLRSNPFWLGFLEAIIERNNVKFNLAQYIRSEDKSILILKPDEIDWDDDTIFFIIATKNYYDEVAHLLREHGREEARDFIGTDGAWVHFCCYALEWKNLFRVHMFMDSYRAFSRWLPAINEKIMKGIEHFRVFVTDGGIVDDAFLTCCVDDENHTVELDGAVIEYDNLHDLAVIFRELLVREEDYFPADNDTPFIIDGGANIGLAIYYFLHEYPKARILAFEPNPKIYRILQQNIQRNKWTNVTAFPYALSNEDGELTFYTQESGLAGSLTRRNFENADVEKISEVRVPSVCLSKYIDSTVDCLKLDVEGSETLVLEEIQEKLDNVKCVSLEFHDGLGKGKNYISKVTGILEKHGFEVNVYNFVQEIYRPMEKVGHRVSESVFARRI